MIDALTEVRRALCQDASNVVLVIDPPVDPDLGPRIARQICDSTRVEIAHLAGLHHAAASRHVLAALGVTEAEPQPDIRARIELELLQRLGASLVLIVPDALRVDESVLGFLGELSKTSGRILRLALLADRRDPSDDPTPRLVQAIGTGAAKIELVDRTRREELTPEVARRQPLMPPIVPDSRGKPPRPIPVRAARRRRGSGSPRRSRPSNGILALAVVALALPVAILYRPDAVLLASVAPEPAASVPQARPQLLVAPRLPFDAMDPIVSHEPMFAVPAAREPGSEAPPETQVLEPAEDETPPPLSEAAVPEMTVSEVIGPRTIPVSLNASPWANIEIDGRDVGPTPIARLPLEPGLRRIKATFPDGRVVERAFRVGALRNHFRID